jgi:hypothetical protein
MIRINSWWVKAVVILLLVIILAWVIWLPTSNEKAISIIGLILLIEAYFLGIDSSIINRIIKMKPLSRVINGLYYIVVGGMLLVVMGLGSFAFFQWALGLFLCIVGVSTLIYQARKGPKVAFSHPDLEKKVSVSSSTTKKDANAKPAVKSGGIKVTIRKYELYTYFVSLGSDLAVTVLFLAIFALMNFVTALLLFILGYIIKFLGDQIAKRSGVVKEVPLPEEIEPRR